MVLLLRNQLRTEQISQSLLETASHQDAGVQFGGGVVVHLGGGVVGQASPRPCRHPPGSGTTASLAGGNLAGSARATAGLIMSADFFRDAQAKQRLGLVTTDHVLRQHQVGQVGVTDFLRELVVVHGGLSEKLGQMIGWCLRCIYRVHCLGTDSESLCQKLESGFGWSGCQFLADAM
jgi:hypothetical protein